jgi:phenylpropionate dioxygenase-like ring-hydroxylating dioxygenase large terminal subunit
MTAVVPSPDVQSVPQVAGGLDPERFDCREAWYPVHYVDDLDPAALTPFTLLERDLVIWWDAQGQTWRAFVDQCPHRLAPLSEGRIAEDGLLECPYHGWAFAGDGECDRIPQQDDGGLAHKAKRACATSLPTAVRQGLLFVYAGTPEYAERVPVPVVEPLGETLKDWVCLNTFRDLPYDALTLLENVLDASHVPFTHHQSVGDRANASPANLEVLETGKQGFQGTWAEGPRRGTLGRQDTTFIAPSLMWHDLTSKQFGRTMTVVYATPIRKGECRVFARFPFQFSSKIPGFFIKLTPRWLSHIGQNAVLEDDQIFLHLQERYLAQQGGGVAFTQAFYLPTKADRFVFEFRQWVNQFQADPFPNAPFPPAQDADTLLDRYLSHTRHCGSCRQALKRIQTLKQAALILAAIAWSSVPLLIALPSLVPSGVYGGVAIAALVAAGTALGLHRLERKFYDGRRIPPRNHRSKPRSTKG